VGIMIKDRLGQEMFGVNTFYREQPIGPLDPGRRLAVDFAMPMNLGEGIYSIPRGGPGAGADHTKRATIGSSMRQRSKSCPIPWSVSPHLPSGDRYQRFQPGRPIRGA